MNPYIRQAWAKQIGCAVDDERVVDGWSNDLATFEAGWQAAITALCIEFESIQKEMQARIGLNSATSEQERLIEQMQRTIAHIRTFAE